MNKKVQLVLEFLAKCKTTSKEYQQVYSAILDELSEQNLCARTIFSCKRIKTLLKNEITSQHEAEIFFKHNLSNKDEEFKKLLKKIYFSLLSSNFSAHAPLLNVGINEFEASLNRVEAKIYKMIEAYIKTILLSLELYIFFDQKKEKGLIEIVDFSKKCHEVIVKNLFYDEEKSLMDKSLKELLTIYVGVYFNFCYQKEV